MATTGQKAHVIAAHAEQKAWVKELEAEIKSRIARTASDRARNKKVASGKAGTGKSGGKAESLSDSKNRKELRQNLKKLPKPKHRGSAGRRPGAGRAGHRHLDAV